MNIEPLGASELCAIGIDTVEELRRIGWEEAFVRLLEVYPERLNLNAATALIGALEDCDFRRRSPQAKEQAQALVRSLRRAAGRSVLAERPRRLR
jgi:hypothetical protein